MRNFTAMALFVEVVLSGSFTAAAKKLGMPLSTLSRKISDLESELKVRLIDRSRRTLRLTDAGSLYFEHCRRGVDAFNVANRALEERQSEAGGLLRISVPPNLTERVFLPAIDMFRLRHPKARVQVLVSERMFDPGADPVDLSFRVGPVSDPDLVVRKLATYRHVLTVSPVYLADYPVPVSPADLADHKLLGFGFQGATELRWSFSRGNEQDHVAFTPTIAINDYAALLEAVVLGFGICELPPILCRDALRRRTIVPLLTDWNLPSVELIAVHAGNRTLSRLARLFLDTCIEHIGGQRADFTVRVQTGRV
ncbi:MAG: LysR family transcriptional regulator [Alphaproteobacteria bacterium]|nr:LysR family transcriptional regulator [Alphaproteobacteria bacterium]